MLVEIYETNSIGQLQLVKSLLKINNIDFEVYNEQILQTGSLESMGIQGAYVKVASTDLEKAKQLMVENELYSYANDEEESAFVKWIDENLDFAFFKGKPPYIKMLLFVGFILFFLGMVVMFNIYR